MAEPILKASLFTSQDALIPYAVSGLNMLAPIFVARDVVIPQVMLVSIALILLGVPCSIFFRQRQYHRILLNLLILVPLLTLTWMLVKGHPGLQFDFADPFRSMMSSDGWQQLEAILNIVVLLSAGRAFLLVTERELLLTPIPSMSIYLLAVITSHQRGTNLYALLCLVILFATSLYLFGRDNRQRWFTTAIPQRLQRSMLLWAFGFTILILPLVFVLGSVLQPFNMNELARRHRNNVGLQWHLFSRFSRSIGLGSDDYVDVGGDGWPNGKQLVMLVHVNDKSHTDLLWRGNTFSYYDLSSARWMRGMSPEYDEQDRSLLTQSSIGKADIAGSNADFAEAIKEYHLDKDAKNVVTQIVTPKVSAIDAEIPVYGAYRMTRIIDSGFTRLRGQRDESVVAMPPDYEPVVPAYTIESVVKPPPTSMHLKADPPLPTDDYRRYLQIPGGNHWVTGEDDGELADKIAKKAREILAERHLTPTSDDFKIVHQFELYLGKNHGYTLKVAPPPNGEDPIMHFLFTRQKGYCNYFSGSMVMLCRSVGIPARLVTGWATGDPLEDTPGDPGTTFKVTADQKHSWVEVYLHHYGWYTSDPTAGSTPEASFLDNVGNGFTAVFSGIKAFFTRCSTLLHKYPRLRIGAYLGSALLIAIVLGILYYRRERPPSLPRNTLSADEAAKTILQSYHRMHRWLNMWGVVKPTGLTATEFERHFRELNPPMGRLVSELSMLYLRAKYGPERLDDADARQALLLLQQLWDMARTERKHLYRTTENVEQA